MDDFISLEHCLETGSYRMKDFMGRLVAQGSAWEVYWDADAEVMVFHDKTSEKIYELNDIEKLSTFLDSSNCKRVIHAASLGAVKEMEINPIPPALSP